MRTVILLSFFALFASAQADDALKLQPAQAFYRKDGLQLGVLLVEEPKAFFANWAKSSETNAATIATRTSFNRGDIVMPAIIFTTTALRSDGTADISYSFEFRRPDGSLYEQMLDKTVINGIPPQGVGLFREKTGLQIEKDDPLGDYSLKVTITDHVTKNTVEIPFTFKVTDEPPPAVSLIAPERQAPAANPRIGPTETPTPAKPGRLRSFSNTNQ